MSETAERERERGGPFKHTFKTSHNKFKIQLNHCFSPIRLVKIQYCD